MHDKKKNKLLNLTVFMVYFGYPLTCTLHRQLQLNEHEKAFITPERWSDVGRVFMERVCLSNYVDPSRPDSSGGGGRAPAWGEAGRSVKGVWGGGGGVGGRGVSQHAAPLGRQAMTFKALPPFLPHPHQGKMLSKKEKLRRIIVRHSSLSSTGQI